MNYSTVINYNFTYEAYENVLVTQVSLASFVMCVNLEAPKTWDFFLQQLKNGEVYRRLVFLLEKGKWK